MREGCAQVTTLPTRRSARQRENGAHPGREGDHLPLPTYTLNRP
jgi:hypothetical protein